MVITLPKTKVGLYSETAAQRYGTAIWRGLDGTPKEVTVVTSPDDVDRWTGRDSVIVGWVDKFISSGPRDGSLSHSTGFLLQ